MTGSPASTDDEDNSDAVDTDDDTGVRCHDECKCETYTRRELRQRARTESQHQMMVYMGNFPQVLKKPETNE